MIVKVCDTIMGAGKAQELDSLVLCKDGYKRMRNIRIGDLVFGEDGVVHPVVGVYPQGVKKICSIEFSDGTKTRCCEDHLWAFQFPQDKAAHRYRIATVKELLNIPLYKETCRGDKNWQIFIPLTKPVQFERKKLLIPPYVLGVILGDGGISGQIVNITNTEADVIERVRTEIEVDGFDLDRWKGTITYGIHDKQYSQTRRNRMVARLCEYGLMGKRSEGKFIPSEYLYSSVEDRLDLIRGLIDTDGSIERTSISYSTVSEQLAKDIVFLAQSLGGTARYMLRQTKYTYNGEVKFGQVSYRVTIKAPTNTRWYYSQKHTAEAERFVQHTEPVRSIRKIEYVGEAECQCIMVDSETHLYLTNDFIVTHNTESAITLMNQDKESRYVFITPYLDEVERIKRSCSGRKFKDPQSKGKGKLENLHYLLSMRDNIASTHALFESYNDETISLIQDGGYKLILDEVFQAVQTIPISPKDLQMLKREMIEVDSEYRVRWVNDDYEGRFEDLRDMCMTGNVILYNDCLLLWKFPIEVFQSFDEVIILTYMFDAQVQKYYFDIHNIEVQRIGTVCENGVYHFSDTPHIPDYVAELPKKIHIVEDEKLNKIGEMRSSLSVSWYKKARDTKGQPLIKQLRNNLTNLFKNMLNSSSDRNLWTVFKDYQALLKGKGYTKGFLSCNVRATNAYRNRDCLAYCVNVYYNPLLKNYFQEQGVEVREDDYALSEMIQWVWRSAIRDGKEIWIYIPSRRMRELFRNWLNDISHGNTTD